MISDSGNSISPATSVDSSLQAKKRVRYVLFQGCIIGGSYEIVKPLGHGGMGEVYLARHIKLDIYRAIKILLPKVAASNPMFATRFMQEARLAIQLQHPNIINVMDAEYDTDSSVYYIVMEYVDGDTVRHLVRQNGPFSEKEALKIVLRVGEALEAAERQKIVHRDIKPDNIMLTKDNAVKVADLGIAKSTAETNQVSMTMPEILIGTPAYISPEQAKDAQTVDSRADIYSLGVSLYEMLAGEKPYKGKNTVEVLEQIFNAPVPDVRKKNPNVSDAVAQLIIKMMSKERNGRPRNWQVFCRTVTDILGESLQNADDNATSTTSWDKVKSVVVKTGGIVLGENKSVVETLAPKVKRGIRYGIPTVVGFGICMLLMSGLLSTGTLTKWKEELTLLAIPENYRVKCEQYRLRPPVNFVFMSDVAKNSWINERKPLKHEVKPIPVPPVNDPDDPPQPESEEYKGRGTLAFEPVASPEVEGWLKQKGYELEVTCKRIGKMSVALPGSLEVPAGKYTLKMRLAECREFPEVPVDLKRDGKQPIKVSVVPVDAIVKINCNVSDFQVWWSKEWLKTSEMKIDSLQNFDLVIRADGYRTFTSTVKLQPGEVRKISVVLEKRKESENYVSQNMKEADTAFAKKNYATAKKYYLEEAERENPAAAYQLGIIFENGYGEWFANKEKAYRYYRMAADKDIPEAIFKVAEFHENGLGNVAKNEPEALSWYRRGAELEHVGCLNKIGLFYENGQAGLAQNPETAITYYQRGATKDNPESQYLLARIFEWKMLAEMSQKEKDALRRQARHWYEEAAKHGFSDAKERMRTL